MLFQNERSLLLGDAVNGSIFLFDDDCLSVPEFKTSLEKLKSQTDGRYDRTYLCHGSGNGTMDLVDGAICFLSVLVPADPFQNDISCKYNGRMTYHWVINKKHKC